MDMMLNQITNDPTITKAAVRDETVTEEQIIRLCSALLHSPKVTKLTLDNCRINDKTATILAKWLPHSAITNLKLKANKIGSAGANALGNMLMNPKCRLERLNLADNKMGALGAAGLAKGLQANSTLKQLDVTGNGIRDKGIEAFAEALATNSTLNKLDVGVNKIGNEGAIAIAKALDTNHSLRRIDLFGNRMGSSGVGALCGVIVGNSNPPFFAVGDNGIPDEAADSVENWNKDMIVTKRRRLN